jgi:aminopeptidase N
VDAVGPKKIADIAHDFTLQPGVPMIEVKTGRCAGDRASGQLDLSQSRFGMDDADKAPRQWRTPVTLKGSVEGAKTVVVGAQAATITTNCPSVVNSGQAGYFRTLYDGAEFAGVETGYSGLSPYDQLGILNDTGAEALAGYAPMADLLDLMVRLPSDIDPVVEKALVNRIAGLDQLYDGLPSQARFRAFALARLRPVSARIGWEAKPGEPPNTESLRTSLLETLGRLGDDRVIVEARARFAKLVAGQTLAPAERQAALGIVAVNADAATWDQIHALAKTAQSNLAKREYYELLGDARNETLARRALGLALSGEPAPTTAPGMISAVARLHPALALKFVSDRWAQIGPMLDSSARGAYAPRLVRGAADLALAQALQSFGAAHLSPDARGDFPKAVATIAYNAKVRAERLPDVDRWLAARAPQ